jgi:WD40 domain-containing protein
MQLHGRPPVEVAAYLELTARQFGHDQLANRVASLPLTRPWSVPWGPLGAAQPGPYCRQPRRLGGGHRPRILNGRPVAVTGGDDGTVRVWDLASGTAVGEPLTGHTGWVRSVAVGTLDGRPIAVTGGFDQTVRMWGLASGTPVGQPLTGHSSEIRAVAVGD